MSKQSTTGAVEDLSQEAAAIPASNGKSPSQEANDLMARLEKENDALKEEMAEIKARVHDTLKKGKEELKSEIAHHPMQSMATAFALGFIASLVVRR